MSDIIKYLRENAYYGLNDKLKQADIPEFLTEYELEPISMGVNSRVFKFKDHPWVVKEGRWDLDVNLFGNTKLKVPRQPAEKVFEVFELEILPRPEVIIKQYKMYLIFCEYFGYFEEGEYFHPRRREILNAQKEIRENIRSKITDFANDFKIKDKQAISALMEDPVSQHNFLPEEYLLFGPAVSNENQGKDTYYIFQKYVNGKLLHDFSDEQIESKYAKKLAYLALLMLVMKQEKNLFPDTRPRHIVQQVGDWLSKTDNIIISEEGVKFIDTRWLWETDANLVKRGLFIPDVAVNQTKKYLNHYLKYV